jgi:hypothetical protein
MPVTPWAAELDGLRFSPPVLVSELLPGDLNIKGVLFHLL